jgi:hypothetical protein
MDDQPDIDPRIDPRLMWPLAYVQERMGFTLVADDSTTLHGDILRVNLERAGQRVHVTWVPATDQRFVSRGQELLGVYGSFAELAEALDRLVPVCAAA